VEKEGSLGLQRAVSLQEAWNMGRKTKKKSESVERRLNDNTLTRTDERMREIYRQTET